MRAKIHHALHIYRAAATDSSPPENKADASLGLAFFLSSPSFLFYHRTHRTIAQHQPDRLLGNFAAEGLQKYISIHRILQSIFRITPGKIWDDRALRDHFVIYAGVGGISSKIFTNRVKYFASCNDLALVVEQPTLKINASVYQIY